MSSQQKNSNGIIVIGVVIFGLICVGFNYVSYQRVTGQIEKNQNRFILLERNLEKLVIGNNEKFNYLSKQKAQHSATDEFTELDNEKQVIKFIKDQNRLNIQILKHYESMQEQITLLLEQVSTDKFLTTSNSGEVSGEINDQKIAQQPITIEELEQETILADKQVEELNRQTEAIFISQSQEGSWAVETNLEIQNALEKIRTEKKFSDLNVNNIDCRESMCKIELSHGDIERFEEFDLAFLIEMSADQPITSRVNTEHLADGNINSIYYLSMN